MHCVMDARRIAPNEPIRASLLEFRRRLIARWSERWPGCEFAKALVGQAIDRALADLAAGSPAARIM